MWKTLTRIVSPGGPDGKLSVLFLHRVLAAHDPLMPSEPDATQFDDMMAWLQSQFNVMPLAEGVRRMADRSLPPAAAAITFDDGYRDNLEIAAPILKRRGLPATFFIATGFLDGGIMFNDVVIESLRATALAQLTFPELALAALPLQTPQQREAAINATLKAVKHLAFDKRATMVTRLAAHCGVELTKELMMTSTELRTLAQMGFDIGAHTVNHPILTRLSDDRAMAEITEGRERLESIIGKKVPLFAYPNGRWGQDFDQRHRDMAQRCGFEAAFSTEPGVAVYTTDRWNLPRFTPWARTQARFRLHMWRNQSASPPPGQTRATEHAVQ